jgi:hypothetical protein
MGDETGVRTFSEGEVAMWIDGAIQFRAVSPFGDPVELTAEAAREIAASLLELAQQLNGA